MIILLAPAVNEVEKKEEEKRRKSIVGNSRNCGSKRQATTQLSIQVRDLPSSTGINTVSPEYSGWMEVSTSNFGIANSDETVDKGADSSTKAALSAMAMLSIYDIKVKQR
ncbi:unnamed protein product [Heligmosomoides polygyrus]|uniref:Uncharacterized protein n=1 Tax=Heligmosomoides polygyrus TaxID=6339 RepID=A0A183FG36_HELPZ|nr:unnamed protein product [Heligmosomoides polygyrus]